MALERPPLPERPAEQRVAAPDVREALRGLTREQRTVLIHVYFRGMSVRTAAEHLGLTQQTVLAATYQALRTLKAALPAGHSLPG
ncbi:sigma-70 family RNA polymerase sigma factor [Streptomyces sp. NPDC001941]|uniref:sigma-70 family RNA polymerase sigma factor n=1 Tax=Streptomyces sp. NPDC001941 TaxID=3154659 RepID=UPI003329F059